MVYLVTTESGSRYRVDTIAMTWERLRKGDPGRTSRKDQGNLLEIPDIKVGEPMYLFDTDVLPGMTHHAVQTTLVVEVQEERYETVCRNFS